MTADKRAALVEKVAEAMWMADPDPYDPASRIPFSKAPAQSQRYCRAEASAALDIALEEAAKVAAQMSDQWDTEWREGLKCSQHLEGMSDGAHSVAEAIRALMSKP